MFKVLLVMVCCHHGNRHNYSMNNFAESTKVNCTLQIPRKNGECMVNYWNYFKTAVTF